MRKIYCDCCGREIEKENCFLLTAERMDGSNYFINGKTDTLTVEICEDCKAKMIEFMKTK